MEPRHTVIVLSVHSKQVCIERILILNLRSRDLLTSESMAVAGDLTPLKTNLFTAAGCLTTNKFVCTTEQRGRSGEKARKGHRSSLYYTTLAIVQSPQLDYVVHTL